MDKAPFRGLIGINAVLKELAEISKASLKWYWRSLAIIVTIASVVSAIFQVLNFYCD